MIEDKIISSISDLMVDDGPLRMESTVPSNFRLAQHKNGTLVLQGAFVWQQGQNGGVEWRNLETIQLDE